VEQYARTLKVHFSSRMGKKAFEAQMCLIICWI
jgi:hypothetical protein